MKDWLEFISSSENLDSYNDKRLAYAAKIVEKMRRAVLEQTGFNCSAGISHNKAGIHPKLMTYYAKVCKLRLFKS